MIPFSKPRITERDVEHVSDAVRSTWVSGGKYIDELEEFFSRFPGFSSPMLTSNGTSALQLAFLSLGLQPGDEIIFPGFCFQAGANIALQMGFKPVFVDVDPLTMNISPHTLGEFLLKRYSIPKVLVVVHNYGYPCDMKTIRQIADNYTMVLIEDCAEALFSSISGELCGTFGDIATFSFHATKTITTGEGGMMITKNNDLAERAKLYRSHGLEVRGTYNHILPGNNFRMSNINAALGMSQLETWWDIVEEKEIIHTLYKGILSNKLDVATAVEVPTSDVCLWSMPVRLRGWGLQDRDVIIQKMLELGVETRPGFVSASKLDYFNCKTPLPNSDLLSNNVVVLPAWLGMDYYTILEVCEKLLSIRRE